MTASRNGWRVRGFAVRSCTGPADGAPRPDTLDADLPVYNIRTMDQHIGDSVFGMMPVRFGASLAGVQGLIALLLALMGLYAVVSYAVWMVS